MIINRPLVLDACCLINIHASGRMSEILEALPVQIHVAETVREQELRQLQKLDALNPVGERFSNLLDRNVIWVADFENEAEQIAFLNYAAAIGDDGEAASFAIAEARAFAVATDDKKARRFATSELPDLHLFYTLDLVEHWMSVRTPSLDEVRQVLYSIRDHGSYFPGPSHPLRAWWDAHL